MELRKLSVLLGLCMLAFSQCSEARHSIRRRDTADEDIFAADEAGDDEPQNDDYEGERTPDAREQPEFVATITTKPKTYEVKPGDEVRLECNIEPDGNGTVVSWYKGDGDNNMYFMNTMNLIHDEPERYSIVNGTHDMVIRETKEIDGGNYRCEVQATSPVSVEHFVIVLESPKIIQFVATNNGQVSEGSDLILTCDVRGKPPPQIVWSRDIDNENQRLGEQDGEFSGNSVLIRGVKREHSGKYYCYAFNSVGHNESELRVSVAGKPHVHVHKTVVNSAINIEALLQCSTHYAANPIIRWYKDGRLIEESSPYRISTMDSYSNLTVIATSDDDFGTFTCEAENDIGRHNRSIELVQRPVVEAQAQGGRLQAAVLSHRPLHELLAQLRPLSEDGEWRQFDIPIPETSGHKYEVVFDLNDKLDPGKYQAVIKARNDHSWSDAVDPVLVEIEAQPQSIQHASVFGSDGHSIRPSSVILSTISMYLLVRML